MITKVNTTLYVGAYARPNCSATPIRIAPIPAPTTLPMPPTITTTSEASM